MQAVTLPPSKPSRRRPRQYTNCLACVSHQQERIQILRQSGLSLPEIARHLGMSTTSLRQALKAIEALKPCEETPPVTPSVRQEPVFLTIEPSERFKRWVRGVAQEPSVDEASE